MTGPGNSKVNERAFWMGAQLMSEWQMYMVRCYVCRYWTHTSLHPLQVQDPREQYQAELWMTDGSLHMHLCPKCSEEEMARWPK